MKQYHCIHCNTINNKGVLLCKKCGKPVREIDKYYIDLVGDEVKGVASDKVLKIISKIILKTLYGLVVPITLAATVVVNVNLVRDDAKVIHERPSINIKRKIDYEHSFETSNAALLYYINCIDKKDNANYDLLSYDKQFNKDIASKLTTYGSTIEEYKSKHSNSSLAINGYDIDLKFNKDNITKSIKESILVPMNSETEIPSGNKIEIDNLEDIEIYSIQLMVREGQFGLTLTNTENFSVVFIKVDGRWYYLYSSSAIPRSLINYTKSKNITDNIYNDVYIYEDGKFESKGM